MKGTAQLAQLEMTLSLADNLNKPVLREVFKQEHGQLAFSVVRVLVTRFVNSFAFTTKLNDEQLDILTVDTLDYFSNESLEDLLLFFKMARTGKFGIATHSIDSNTIFGEWIPKYLELKAEAREDLLQKQKNERLQKDNANAVQHAYQRAKMKADRLKREQYIENMVQNFDRQMLEDTIISWQKDDEMKGYVPLLKRKRRTIKNK